MVIPNVQKIQLVGRKREKCDLLYNLQSIPRCLELGGRPLFTSYKAGDLISTF